MYGDIAIEGVVGRRIDTTSRNFSGWGGTGTVRHLPLLLLAPVSLTAACDWPTAPLPPGAERFDPPAVYQQWWELTQECSGLSDSMDDINWYHVPGARTIPHERGPVTGWWSSSGNKIVLAGDARLWGDIVRHEMLHALLQRGGHPRSSFIAKCSGVVYCDQSCLTDEGPPSPDPTAEHVAPSQLVISVEVAPSTPSSAVMDGHFMMVIRARNPLTRSVIVDLPPAGDDGPPGSFGYRTVHATGYEQYDMRAHAIEVTRFRPGEEKRFIFDFRNSDGETRYDKPPLTYRFDGRYGGVWAPNPPTVTVEP